ncbi:DUF6093 family protein [Micromonospora sp. NPDC049366]|uniref:DUF6093 family protein n=1 Tax=Micromonospora sp. NPDC049366 TaxID=3364271 RepID=UPI0037AF046D
MPLRNTRFIHPRWRPHHEPAVLGTMTARLRLSKPGRLGVRDPVTGATPKLPPQRYYEGPGRVQSQGGTSPAGSTGERDLSTAAYLVAVPVDLVDASVVPVPAGVLPELGDLVDVLDADDPLLAGVRLYVTAAPGASIVLQRNLGADLHPPTTPGG